MTTDQPTTMNVDRLATPCRWRKKSVEIEAIHYEAFSAEGYTALATKIIDWIIVNGGNARYHHEPMQDIVIDTLEGTMTASRRDVIIKGLKGEFYPCKPDIFDGSYELVEEPLPVAGQVGQTTASGGQL
jgi:hypothetical protein